VNILATQYTLQYKSLDIYVAGCSANPHCTQCHNPESWDFNNGTTYDKKYFKLIKNKVNSFDSLIDNIMIMGGEPLDQDIADLIKILKDISQLNKTIWLFTRYNLSDVPDKIKNMCDYIKCGRYLPDQKCCKLVYGIELSSYNQTIYQKGIAYAT
jgi:anaerobic ribonucleoside-triphosphate reductase activating protein